MQDGGPVPACPWQLLSPGPLDGVSEAIADCSRGFLSWWLRLLPGASFCTPGPFSLVPRTGIRKQKPVHGVLTGLMGLEEAAHPLPEGWPRQKAKLSADTRASWPAQELGCSMGEPPDSLEALRAELCVF